MVAGTKEEIGKVVACYRAMRGKDLDMGSFPDRIRLQKLIYILKTAGIAFPSRFSWHVRGPYSSDLADKGFEYQRHREEGGFSYSLDEREKRIIQRVRSISDYLEDVERSELLSSLLFLQKALKLEGKELVDELRIRKPRFTEAEIAEARRQLAKITD